MSGVRHRCGEEMGRGRCGWQEPFLGGLEWWVSSMPSPAVAEELQPSTRRGRRIYKSMSAPRGESGPGIRVTFHSEGESEGRWHLPLLVRPQPRRQPWQACPSLSLSPLVLSPSSFITVNYNIGRIYLQRYLLDASSNWGAPQDGEAVHWQEIFAPAGHRRQAVGLTRGHKTLKDVGSRVACGTSRPWRITAIFAFAFTGYLTAIWATLALVNLAMRHIFMYCLIWRWCLPKSGGYLRRV